jgi:hypothetical protein
MISEKYNRLSRFLHSISLGSNTISELSFEINRILFYSSNKIQLTEGKNPVFISGLARSGTTAILNHLYETKKFATLTYQDMPFVLAPNLWRKLTGNSKQTELKERAHGDKIFINNQSPEAIDEVFWKVFLNNEYIEIDSLKLNNISNEILTKYQIFTELICLKYFNNKSLRYISKNNNSILRIESLRKQFDSCKIIIPYRSPLEHAQSLLEQHIHFSKLQLDNPFILKYMNWIGHYEFGLNQKPFDLNQKTHEKYTNLEIHYWLNSWLNYYSYVLTKDSKEDFVFVNYDDLCQKPNEILNQIAKKVNIDYEFSNSKIFNKREKSRIILDQNAENILNECMIVYQKLITQTFK